jgi:tripartite ATP-independent transporter DctM subunit
MLTVAETVSQRPAHGAAGTLVRGAAQLLRRAAGLVLAVLLALVLASVTARYVFATSFLGADELAIWLHVALIAIGAPLVSGSALAMKLDSLTVRLPPAARWMADLLADAVVVHAGLVLASGSMTAIALIGGTSPSLGLPEWVRYAFMLFAGGGTVLAAGVQATAQRGGRWALLAVALGVASYTAGTWLLAEPVGSPSLVASLVALAALAIGAPTAHALILGASLAIPFGSLLPEPAIVQNAVSGISGFLLLAIPFFLLAGGFLTEGGLAHQFVRLAAALVGHRRGGIAQTTLLTSVFFSGASGSSIANAAFGAKVMVPALTARGYPPPQAAAIVAATSLLDNIIPPSIAFLMLATAVTNLSVGSLMVGGFFAGLVLAAALAIALHLTAREAAMPSARATGAQRLRALRDALPALGLACVVVLGIRFGVVTTTEAAAVAALYALVVCCAMRTISPATILRVLEDAAVETAAIGLLIAASAPFTFLLAVDQVGDVTTEWLAAFGNNPAMFMLISNLVLLVAGMALDTGAGILLFGPLLIPVAAAMGIDPVHYGVILVINLMIGGLTPPVGMLVFVSAGLTGVSADSVFRACNPLLLALIAAMALLAAAAVIWPLL